jgi:serine/threonine protein kinase
MKPDDWATSPTAADPYATRAPSPESLEAMELATSSMEVEGDRVRGVSLEEFERGLIECGFLDAEGVREAKAGLPDVDQTSGAEGLARALVKLGKLTRYQAAALFQGKGRALLIGPYVVLDKLGSGGMGMVFKARPRKGGAEIALKLLPPSASKHPHAVARFRREAQIMARLDHPNLVASHEIGSYGGVHYLVMDYVKGRDLDRVVRSGGPMKVARAVDCVIQAARGLLAAHEQGIVHRDVKPANLLLDAKGNVRVLDLGLARITQGDDSLSSSKAGPSLTQSGIIMGTVDFVPPEQSDDSKRADHRADVYSLGCTLYFLLTGKSPYSGETIMQRLVAHHQKPIPSLIEARPEVPSQLDAIFRSMLAKAPEDRPQSMVEVIASLEACRGSLLSAKKMRVFNDEGASKATPAGSKVEPAAQGPSSDPGSTEEPETYDLMTFVRSELFEPDSDESSVSPAPILARKPRKYRSGRNWIDLGVRVLVAAAAIAVLIRFFPKIPFKSPATTTTTPAKTEPAVDVPVTPEAPRNVEVPEPKAKPAAAPPASPKVSEQPPIGQPPPRSLLEDLLGPPPRRPGDPGPPEGPPPPRSGKPNTKDGKPIPPSTKARPPQPEDQPPPKRPATTPDGGSVPF